MEIVISKSKKPDKKEHDAIIYNTTTASFGEKGASDHTKHKDKKRKGRYVDRHKKHEVGLNQVYKLLGG